MKKKDDEMKEEEVFLHYSNPIAFGGEKDTVW